MISTNQNDGVIDKAKGVIWGSILGDVIGAFLQFNRSIDENKVNQAFLIKGGGMHKLEPGQPTDDSQLSFALGKGLLRGKGCLNLNMIAEQMGNWFLSKPIDVGGTIRNSVPKACNMKVHQAHLCRKGAKQNSQTSQSNGTLMAIAPLAIWCNQLKDEDIIRVVRQYTILIHPNQLVILSNTFHVLMITFILKQNIKTTELKKNAFQYAKQVLRMKIKESKQKQEFFQWIQLIQQAIEDKSLLQQKLSAQKKSGWVRIALSYAIYTFLTQSSFKDSIRFILRLKGDTDTNACIAGSLLGSFYGFTAIQSQLKSQIQIIRKWRPNKVKRPQWLVPGIVAQKLALSISQISPKDLKIIGSLQQYL